MENVQREDQKNIPKSRILNYIQVIGAILAITGFCYGLIKYFHDKSIETSLMVKNEINENIERLIKFPVDDKFTVSKVIFLIGSLSELVEIDESEKDKITDIIVEMITNECDFDLKRHVRFDIVTLINCGKFRAFRTRIPVQFGQ